MAALQLARLGAPERDWLDASAHLSLLAREAAAIGAVLNGRTAEARIGALAGLIHARFGYRGDRETYDDLDNANLIRVIERRRGLPVALGVIWLHCIHAAGWEGWGIDFPGHFLVALGGAQGAGTLIDVFGEGATVGSPDLLALLAGITGHPTPIEPGMLRPMAVRDVLLRLQRNLVGRRAAAGDRVGALASLEGMLLMAPDVAPHWLQAADLHRVLGQTDDAIACLERFLALVPSSDASDQARAQIALLRQG
ncbi:SirB1 family protein [Lichenicoccus sp.]|uniref:SirB1 family protein n=1 Tax=Lichenicoccus sp. TaxID=2781899 RepID=UPI003D0B2293